jgi:hypothetical protein
MLRFKTGPYIANGYVDPGPPSVADQFAEIMVHICLEYDLEPDVLGAAQDVLQALKAKGRKRVEPDREAILPAVVSRAARPPWPFSQSDL